MRSRISVLLTLPLVMSRVSLIALIVLLHFERLRVQGSGFRVQGLGFRV